MNSGHLRRVSDNGRSKNLALAHTKATKEFLTMVLALKAASQRRTVNEKKNNPFEGAIISASLGTADPSKGLKAINAIATGLFYTIAAPALAVGFLSGCTNTSQNKNTGTQAANSPTPAQAGTNTPVLKQTAPSSATPTPAPEFKPGFNPLKLFNIDYGSMGDEGLLLEAGVKAVANYQPNKSNVFNWTGDRSKFKNIEFAVIATKANSLPDHIKSKLPEKWSGDAVTDIVPDKKNKEKKFIHIYLLIDQIFKDDKNMEQLDGAARLMTALGREIYGNLQTYVDKIADGTLDQQLTRKQREIAARTASVEFLQRVIASSHYKSFNPMMQQGLKDALQREKTELVNWQSAPE